MKCNDVPDPVICCSCLTARQDDVGSFYNVGLAQQYDRILACCTDRQSMKNADGAMKMRRGSGCCRIFRAVSRTKGIKCSFALFK